LFLGAAVLAAATANAARPTDKVLADDRDGANWSSYGRTFSEQHFSPLTQINDRNVSRLGLAWSYDLPMTSVFTAPLAVDGRLYFAIGLSQVFAMDAKTGTLLWHYDPKVPEASSMKLRGAWGIRGLAYADGRVFVGTQDGRLLGLDAKSGALQWSVQTTEPGDLRYVTGPPWVFKGLVAIGHGGGDFGVRGYVTAYDQKTGQQRWRFYTVPGDPAKGFENKAMEMAAKTWSGEWWKFGGGGTVWHAMAYDRRFNRLYIGTGNGSPWNRKIRSDGKGDNLFLASIVALDADTGEYVWHYQVNPGESWDYNADMDIELADLKIDGKMRPVILHAPKNGFFYVIDRETGKLISAEKIATVTWAERIDIATGRPVENPLAQYPDGKEFRLCPGPFGAHNLAAMSYNPKTRLVYVPTTTNMCLVYKDPPGNLKDWTPQPNFLVNTGAAFGGSFTGPAGSTSLLAWDPVTQKKAWEAPLPNINNGGTMTSAGNLVFQGTVTGEFRAYAADTGKPLWSFDARAGIQGQPITYLVDGKQYVTVLAGWRGLGTGVGLDPEWDYRTQQRRVLTFVLDGTGTLPPRAAPTPFVDDSAFVVDEAKATQGLPVYEARCFMCHGSGVNAGGMGPDLRKSQVMLSLAAMKSVMHEGSLLPRGMPLFTDLSPDEIEAIQHYVRKHARAAIAAQKSPKAQQ